MVWRLHTILNKNTYKPDRLYDMQISNVRLKDNKHRAVNSARQTVSK